MRVRTVVVPSSVVVCAAFVAACSGEAPDGAVGKAQSALGCAAQGKELFENALDGTNGRSCATCHVPSKGFSLRVDDVARRFMNDPNEPLFNVIDSDDPTAATPTYDHVKAGLVRVNLTLADNLDVIDDGGNVITNATRTIAVWRGVPTALNTAYTAPFQYDARFATLQIQADAALHGHSQIDHEPDPDQLDDIAAFEETLFSDHRAQHIARVIEHGGTPQEPDYHLTPGSPAAKGQALFQQACAPCHGTPTETVITRQDVHDQLFPVIAPDGTVSAMRQPGSVAVATNVRHDPEIHNHHQLNIGITFGTVLGQQPGSGIPNLTGVDFPHYRIRFYTDASRSQKLVDLPPLVPAMGPPPIGPSLGPEPWSTDPGRAIISGDPSDWEAFEVPQLRGIKHTPPYFHDGSAPDLPTVIQFYSLFIVPGIPQLGFPPVVDSGLPNPTKESFTAEQKANLLAFLERL
jgi:cytochrome c peroxidase